MLPALQGKLHHRLSKNRASGHDRAVRPAPTVSSVRTLCLSQYQSCSPLFSGWVSSAGRAWHEAWFVKTGMNRLGWRGTTMVVAFVLSSSGAGGKETDSGAVKVGSPELRDVLD